MMNSLNRYKIYDCDIEAGIEQYTRVVLEEHTEEGSYQIVCGEDLITTTSEPQEHLSVDREIDLILSELFDEMADRAGKKKVKVSLHSDYDCGCVICKKPIEDKDPLILVKYTKLSSKPKLERIDEVTKPCSLCQTCFNNIDSFLNQIQRRHHKHSEDTELFMP